MCKGANGDRSMLDNIAQRSSTPCIISECQHERDISSVQSDMLRVQSDSD